MVAEVSTDRQTDRQTLAYRQSDTAITIHQFSYQIPDKKKTDRLVSKNTDNNGGCTIRIQVS